MTESQCTGNTLGWYNLQASASTIVWVMYHHIWWR